MSGSDQDRPLAGRWIGVPETRELQTLVKLLENQGARTWACPLVGILDAPDPAPIHAWLDILLSGGLDDLIILTGEGIRRLEALASQRGQREAFLSALGSVRKITRGPKPARLLTDLGLKTDLAASPPTSQGVIQALTGLELKGRRVGLQLYGQEPNLPLTSFLSSQGAQVFSVAPYIYAPATDAAQVLAWLQAMADGRLDLVAFTSSAQVRRLLEVAQEAHCEELFAQALGKVKVAAVGPVVAEELQRHQVSIAAMPPRNFFLKPLTQQILQLLTTPAE